MLGGLQKELCATKSKFTDILIFLYLCWKHTGGSCTWIKKFTFPPIITVLGTNSPSGFFLILLYWVIMCKQFNNCLLYSWILFTCAKKKKPFNRRKTFKFRQNRTFQRFTWMSNIELTFILTLYSLSSQWASFILFSCLTFWTSNMKLWSFTSSLSFDNSSKCVIQLSPILYKIQRTLKRCVNRLTKKYNIPLQLYLTN